MHYYFLDIIECDDDNGGCSQLCNNTVGSYYCECNTGYHFFDNSTTICIGMKLTIKQEKQLHFRY